MQINIETISLQWDADGQLLNVMRLCTGDLRHHWWDEKGLLTAFADNEYCGYYGYDGEGNRVYKLTGQTAINQYNAGEQNFQMYFNDAVLYVNPYMVVTPRSYTKHYYNGNQRVAAYIGDITDLPNDIIDVSDQALERISNAREYMYSLLNANEVQYMEVLDSYVDIDGNPLAELQWSCYDGDWTLNTNVYHGTNFLYPILAKSANLSQRDVPSLYYYHPDHLGSTTWVTDESGEPVEYIHYMPYGELWIDEQATGYSERYRFTGKERDSESGYDYFGARYYSSTLPMWLSVDPLSDKYPHISPYAYCGNNPIKYVDPDGKKIVVGTWYGRMFAKLGFYNFEYKVQQDLVKLKTLSSTLLRTINNLENSEATYYILPHTKRDDYDANANRLNWNGYHAVENVVYYDPDNIYGAVGERPPKAGLMHELGHAENDDQGKRITYNREEALNGNIEEKEKWNKNERHSIELENEVYKSEGLNIKRDEEYIK